VPRHGHCLAGVEREEDAGVEREGEESYVGEGETREEEVARVPSYDRRKGMEQAGVPCGHGQMMAQPRYVGGHATAPLSQ